MVQSDVHAEDERPRADGDPGQPGTDEASARVSQPITPGDSLEEILRAEHPAEPSRHAQLLRRAGIELIAWFKTLASAAVYATLIVTFGFQVARVEGKSMEPTLQDQDRLIVNKAVYHFSDWQIVGPLVGARDPERGDIVMLKYRHEPEKNFVKRIIAGPGDTVRIENGQVYVNEVLQPDAEIPPEFRSHEDRGPEVVQEAFYYVMGDHRNNSSDSRHWGQVPKDYIIGRVQVRWWPLTDVTLF